MDNICSRIVLPGYQPISLGPMPWVGLGLDTLLLSRQKECIYFSHVARLGGFGIHRQSLVSPDRHIF